MSTILKVQLNEEIRRISLDAPITLAGLETKIRNMFAQQLLDSQSFSIYAVQTPSTESKIIANERDLQEAFLLAVFSSPPILRLTVIPGNNEKQSMESLVSASGLPAENYITTNNEVEDPTIEVTCSVITDDEAVDEHPTVINTSVSTSLSEVEDAISDAVCNICSKKNVYNRCLNCLNVYICDDCSLLPSSVHDTEHVWIRLTKSISELPLKTQLLLISHLDSVSERNETRSERKRLRTAVRKENIHARQERNRLRKQNQREQRLKRQAERKSKAVSHQEQQIQEESEESKILEQLNQLDVVCDEVFESVNALDRSLNNQEEEDSLAVQLKQLDNLVKEQEQKEESEVTSLSTLITDCQLPNTSIAPEVVEVVDANEDYFSDAEEVLPVTFVDDSSPEIDTAQYTISGISFNEKLASLEKMGFTDRRKNMFYLIKNLSSLERTVEDLLG